MLAHYNLRARVPTDLPIPEKHTARMTDVMEEIMAAHPRPAPRRLPTRTEVAMASEKGT